MVESVFNGGNVHHQATCILEAYCDVHITMLPVCLIIFSYTFVITFVLSTNKNCFIFLKIVLYTK